MDNNLNTSAELEQLRTEYAALKKKLDNQEIISDRLMLDSVRGKMEFIDKQQASLMFCCIAVMLCAPFFRICLGTSWWFCGATFIYMGYICCRVIRDRRYFLAAGRAGKDMLPVLEKIKYFRMEYARHLNTGLPLAVVWVAWMFIEIYRCADGSRAAAYVLCGAAAVLVVAATVLLGMRARVIRSCDAIIGQLKN